MPSSTVTLTTTTASSSSSSLPGPSSSSSSPSSAHHAAVIASPALAHLSPADRHKFASYGLGQRRKVDIPIVHHGFERQVRLQPDAIAVEHSLHNHSLTYGQLDRKANRLARRLRYAHDVRPGTRVCVLACRSIYYLLAVLAVLKAGGQYVPIDGVTVTDATLQHILVDSAADLCLVMREYRPRVGDTTPALVIEDAMDEDERAAACADKPEDLSSPDDGCYVIYTSGTTGKPKGVDVRHRGVTNVISGSPGNVGMRPGMRVAQLLNIAFDMGAWECLSALYNGCTLCLRGNSSKEWAALLKTVDVVISTPSILARHNPTDYPTIKHVIVGGEPCPQALADNWARYTTFNNCCGPTEISICNTVQRHTPGYPLSIGTPIPNTNVYILGRDPTDTRAAEIGEVGCMWVGGVGVSRGYLNLPEKTAERWAPDPFLGIEGARMFNTGDLGRWRADGQLDHHGRADDQVKVKGFRVELDGVSAAMRVHPDVSAAVALLVEDKLWGFVTPADVDLEQVRKATAKLQPYYAVPSEWLALDAFTFTPNGKVDKRALRALAEASRISAQSGPSNASTPAAAAAPAAARPEGLGLATPPNHLAVASQPYAQSLPGTPYMPPKKSSLPPSPSESAFGIPSRPSPPSSVRGGDDDERQLEGKSAGGSGPRLMLALAVAIGAVLMVSALARVERSKLFGL